MNEDAFLRKVREKSEISDEEGVWEAAEATLDVFGERITKGEARELAEDLPERLSVALTDTDQEEAADFGVDEFLSRVRNRMDEKDEVDGNKAPQHVTGVMHALAEESGGDEWLDVLSQLPGEYRQLFDEDGRLRTDDPGAT